MRDGPRRGFEQLRTRRCEKQVEIELGVPKAGLCDIIIVSDTYPLRR
jgi:hypothetical protein